MTDSLTPAFALVDICGLHKSFGPTEVLKGIDLKVGRKEVVSIIGTSGSGTSTLVRLIHFEHEATAGEIYLNNGAGPAVRENLIAQSPFRKRQVRSRCMGIVYQNPHLGLRMQVSSGGNIAEKLLAAGWRSVAEIRGRAASLLERTEIPIERMDEPPANFSGGMQQRVQIAKALSNSPQVLLLAKVVVGHYLVGNFVKNAIVRYTRPQPDLVFPDPSVHWRGWLGV